MTEEEIRSAFLEKVEERGHGLSMDNAHDREVMVDLFIEVLIEVGIMADDYEEETVWKEALPRLPDGLYSRK